MEQTMEQLYRWGIAQPGKVGLSTAWKGGAQHSLVRWDSAQPGKVGLSTAWKGGAQLSLERWGSAQPGKVGLSTAWKGGTQLSPERPTQDKDWDRLTHRDELLRWENTIICIV